MAIKTRIVYYYEVFLRNSLRRDNILGLKYRVESSFGGLGLGAPRERGGVENLICECVEPRLRRWGDRDESLRCMWRLESKAADDDTASADRNADWWDANRVVPLRCSTRR